MSSFGKVNHQAITNMKSSLLSYNQDNRKFKFIPTKVRGDVIGIHYYLISPQSSKKSGIIFDNRFNMTQQFYQDSLWSGFHFIWVLVLPISIQLYFTVGQFQVPLMLLLLQTNKLLSSQKSQTFETKYSTENLKREILLSYSRYVKHPINLESRE